MLRRSLHADSARRVYLSDTVGMQEHAVADAVLGDWVEDIAPYRVNCVG